MAADAPESAKPSCGPDPRLRSLDRLVGTWTLENVDVITGERWAGMDTFEWMPGGCFMAYHHEEFGRNITGIMLIGFATPFDGVVSTEIVGHWFESTTGSHFEYVWDVDAEHLNCWLGVRDSNIYLHGTFDDQQRTMTGEWRWPGGGYDIIMTRR